MLEVRNIWKNYESQPLLCGVSFSVQAGETVCLLGSSGSGKSTLLRIISGLEPAEAGQVFWQGRDVSGIPVYQRNFGLMFQEYALFPHRSVAENVAFGLRMQGVNRAEINMRVAEALDLVNMASFSRRRVTDLSGGEQQRVALARALAPRPRLLMLDEPLGSLDRTLKEDVKEEIRQLLHTSGIPAIYVTHDQEEAFAIADRLILLNQGRIEQSGSPVEVYTWPVSAWVAQFLGLSNLVSGKVVGIDPLRVQTDLGVFQGVWGVPGQPQPGRLGKLLLRPTAARLAKDFSGPEGNCLRGIVLDSVFRGMGFRIILQCANGQHFSFQMGTALSVGQEIVLTLAEEDLQFLEDKHG
jgi:spermidine/putrescine transport system ATP-binding protein